MPAKSAKKEKLTAIRLDEQCLKILEKVPAGKKGDFIRNAIKHYAECTRIDTLNEMIERFDFLLQDFEEKLKRCGKYRPEKVLFKESAVSDFDAEDIEETAYIAKNLFKDIERMKKKE